MYLYSVYLNRLHHSTKFHLYRYSSVLKRRVHIRASKRGRTPRKAPRLNKRVQARLPVDVIHSDAPSTSTRTRLTNMTKGVRRVRPTDSHKDNSHSEMRLSRHRLSTLVSMPWSLSISVSCVTSSVSDSSVAADSWSLTDLSIV